MLYTQIEKSMMDKLGEKEASCIGGKKQMKHGKRVGRKKFREY